MGLRNILGGADEATKSIVESGPIRVIVAGFPDVAQPFISALPPGNNSGVEVLSFVRDSIDLTPDVENYKPQLVLISPNIRNYSTETVKTLANWPEFPIAVVGLVPATGAWGSEMAGAGAIVFYNTPVTPAVVEQFAREAPAIVEKARSAWRAPAVNVGVARPVLEAVTATAYRTGAIAFWSIKGGVGKTSLATETAVTLSQVGGKRTLLIDSNMNGGDIAARLGLQELADKNNIVHLASDFKTNRNQLTARMLEARVTKVDAHVDPHTKVVTNRLDILLGLPNAKLAGSEALKGAQGEQFVTELLRLAREHYEFVIVDCGSSIGFGAHLGALSTADIVLFVINDDIAAIKNNRENLEVLWEERSISRDKFRLVINQYDKRSNISLKDIATYLRAPVFATVPEETSRAFRNTHNEEKSFVLSHLNIRKNSPEVEATMRGIFTIAEGLFPPLGAIIKARDTQLDGDKKGNVFGWGKKK